MFKKILLVLLIILIIIQFIHPARNISKTGQPNNIATVYQVPDSVKRILDKACMDCHSNNTRYLWYFKIQPVDWWLTHHIDDGKDELNFDEFTNKPIRYQYNKLEESEKQIKEGEMPLDSYTWMHKDATLTEQEKNTFMNWAETIRNEIKGKYPADSLKRQPRPEQKP
ncbi:MAG: cytochrome C [Bacteroidetes bacterium]|nr:MAG: cytochrome C [Bacteroidota bacterium]